MVKPKFAVKRSSRSFKATYEFEFRDTDLHVTPPPDDGHGDPEQTGHGVTEQTYEIIQGVCYGVIALGVTSLFFFFIGFINLVRMKSLLTNVSHAC